MEYDFSKWHRIYRDKEGRFKFELANGQSLPLGIDQADLLEQLRTAVDQGRVVPVEIESVYD